MRYRITEALPAKVAGCRDPRIQRAPRERHAGRFIADLVVPTLKFVKAAQIVDKILRFLAKCSRAHDPQALTPELLPKVRWVACIQVTSCQA